VSDPVTAIVRARVRTEAVARFQEITRTISRHCQAFPGYQGTRVIEPADPTAERVTIFSFDSYDNYRRWELSAERRRCLAALDEVVEAPPRREQISGLSYWFDGPRRQGAGWPPSWRMTAVAFLAILPLSWFIPPAVRLLLPQHPALAGILAIAAVTVVMSYVSLPLMAFLLRRWL
jgi:antibiotic biosynthesis monooxygenase (ABM) superfamily enzyme